MKRKIYYMISSIIQVTASLYAMLKANDIVSELMESITMQPEVMRERLTSLYQNSGTIFVYVLATICILANVFIFVFAMNDKLLEKRKSIIALSIITFLMADLTIIQLMSVINLIVIATVKKEELAKIKVPEKKKIPNLEKEEINKEKIIKAILLLFIYFSQFIWESFLPDNDWAIIIVIGFYVVLIGLSIWFFLDVFKTGFKEFKNNFPAYMRYILPKLGIFYLVFIVVSSICTLITNSVAANQETIESMPFYLSFPLAVIYAPIVEETLFRGCIRRFIKNNTLFIIISGIVFGLLHTAFSESSLLNTIFLTIPYGIMGSFFAYLYTKTNNIMSNISCHFFNNFVALLLSLMIVGI